MTLIQIKSDRVRAIIASSPTPASDLCDQSADLPVADFREACEYFGGFSAIKARAIAERTWGITHDV